MGSREPRVTPTMRIGVAVYLVYLVVFIGVWVLNDVDYLRIGESADTLLRWYLLPLSVAAVVVIAVVSGLGWWRVVLVEQRRVPRWALIPGALMLAGAAIALATNDYSGVTAPAVAFAVIGSILVGFNEEIVTRGVVLTAARSRFREPIAWLVSTGMFALLHLPNGFLGEGLAVGFQIVITFGLGTVLYLVRRGTGSLVPAMVVHGSWDLASFLGEDTTGTQGLLTPLVILVGIITVIVVLRRPAQNGQ